MNEFLHLWCCLGALGWVIPGRAHLEQLESPLLARCPALGAAGLVDHSGCAARPFGAWISVLGSAVSQYEEQGHFSHLSVCGMD